MIRLESTGGLSRAVGVVHPVVDHEKRAADTVSGPAR
jgi:hypothetical protein